MTIFQQKIEFMQSLLNTAAAAASDDNDLFTIVRRHERPGAMHEIYNFPVLNGEITVGQLMDMVEQIYANRATPFRLNLAIGFILNSIDEELPRYFHPYRNAHEFERSVFISSQRDLVRLRRRLEKMNIQDRVMTKRPSSKWSVSLLTNVTFEIVDATATGPLGCLGVEVPFFVNRKKGVVDFPSRDDNLCFFRCLAYFFDARVSEVDEYALKLFSLWKGECTDDMDQKFEGVEDGDIDELEDLFQVNVTIFRLQPDNRAETVRASEASYERTLYLNVYDGHVSFITSPESFCGKYVCSKCSMTFPDPKNAHRHEKVCRGLEDEEQDEEVGGSSLKTRRRYAGGYFKETPGIFQRLREFLIDVDEKDEEYRWFSCFDCECLLKDLPADDEANSACISEHELVSVAVAGNVPGFEKPVCFIDPSPSRIVEEMLLYLSQIQGKASELSRLQFKSQHDELKEKLELCEDEREKKQLLRLLDDFESFMDRLPVLGFNSSR